MTPEKENQVGEDNFTSIIFKKFSEDGNFRLDASFKVSLKNDENVWEFFPKTFNDKRGYFRVDWDGIRFSVPKSTDNLGWVRQINTSSSKLNVFRGMHAQIGRNCQGKLVTCKRGVICDLIVDCRTDSSTFMRAKSYLLFGDIGNSLWVPRGFLHGFLSMEEDSIFEYMCDAPYDSENETGVNVFSLLSKVWGCDSFELKYLLSSLKAKGALMMSDKDEKQQDLDTFLSSITENWYKG